MLLQWRKQYELAVHLYLPWVQLGPGGERFGAHNYPQLCLGDRPFQGESEELTNGQRVEGEGREGGRVKRGEGGLNFEVERGGKSEEGEPEG